MRVRRRIRDGNPHGKDIADHEIAVNPEPIVRRKVTHFASRIRPKMDFSGPLRTEQKGREALLSGTGMSPAEKPSLPYL